MKYFIRKKGYTMKLRMLESFSYLIILIMCAVVNSKRSDSWMDVYVNNESAFRYYLKPCTKNSENATNTLFKPGELPSETQNPYLVLINQEYSITSVDLTLDSAGTIYFCHDIPYKTAVASNFTLTTTFSEEIHLLSFIIEKSKPSSIPLVSSLEINGIKLCKDPDQIIFPTNGFEGEGIQDRFLEFHKEFESVTLPKTDYVCGERTKSPNKLIVKGSPSKPGDWPWHTAIDTVIDADVSYICGGTLISEFYVLTAAHCVTRRHRPVNPATLSVRLGKTNLNGYDEGLSINLVEKIKVHDSYNFKTLSNDIALLKLKNKVVINDYVRPACLWQSELNDKLLEPIFGTVVGWGIDHTDQLSSQLQEAKIPMIKEINCLKSNRAFFGSRLDDNNFCAGYLNGTSACNGDSGGGFTISVEGRYYVRGIVSSAIARNNENKCDPNQYALFTDVEKYLLWIHDNMKM